MLIPIIPRAISAGLVKDCASYFPTPFTETKVRELFGNDLDRIMNEATNYAFTRNQSSEPLSQDAFVMSVADYLLLSGRASDFKKVAQENRGEPRLYVIAAAVFAKEYAIRDGLMTQTGLTLSLTNRASA